MTEGDARLLPRPWEPATCRTPQLRQQLWLWLDAVVEWLVTEYVWEPTDTISGLLAAASTPGARDRGAG
jgi:hypothetical protein